ncbi:MAG: peroxiredoxin-like family protein [Aulosira sp. ZfuVER01]|nr:peroxiredoxin-like family protein [Aulosira sp. ZfuVER01]MDZ8002870.1 peroxiredoxin-like family protein [Aulosira sp. DedVER01a]MDZ8056451.1 peroxiredoxin-like family protein [Aulosira sp. ZfuCHP01]
MNFRESFINELVSSGIVNQSLKLGDLIPNFTLPNAYGETIEIEKLLVNGPVVISFFRGSWCAFCNSELAALQQALPAIRTLGASLIAISPQTNHHTGLTVEKHELTYEVLSDRSNHIAREFGIVFQIPEYLRPILKEKGYMLPRYNGDESFELPIPATFIVSQDGKVIYAFVDPDYTKRLDTIEIISILRNVTLVSKS